MKKLSPKKICEARINRAISGFEIPMLSIPALCKVLEALIESGESDEALKQVVAGFPGVKESI